MPRYCHALFILPLAFCLACSGAATTDGTAGEGVAGQTAAGEPTKDESGKADKGKGEVVSEEPVGGVPLPPCEPDDEMCRVERLGDDSLGWLTSGLTAADVEAKLGEPAKRGPIWEEGATGYWVSEWEWPAQGISLGMAADTETGPMSVNSVTIWAPCDLKTERGVGIGSTEAEIKAAYEGLADPHFTTDGEQFVAGSVYGGIFFTFENGLVTSIFVGAGAE